MTKGVDKGAWYNEFFLRGAPGEITKMVRIKIKGKKKQDSLCNAKVEPDFYNMPSLPFPPSFSEETWAGPRRGSMECISSRKFRFGSSSQIASPEEVGLPLPGTSLSIIVSMSTDITMLAASTQQPPAFGLNWEKCRDVMISPLSPIKAKYQAASPIVVRSVVDKASSTSLEPLPFEYKMWPACHVGASSVMTLSKRESLPIDDDIPEKRRHDVMISSPLSPKAEYRAASPVVICLVVDEANSTSLEPLPFEYKMWPACHAGVSSMMTSKREYLPIDDGIPLDEFARHIDDAITLL